MWTPVIVGTAITILAVPLYFVMQEAFGIEGVAVTSVVTLGTYTAVLMAIWYRPKDARSGLGSVLLGAGRAIPLVVPAAFAAGGMSWAISTGISGSPLVSGALALGVGAAVYAGVAIGIGALLFDWFKRPGTP